MCCVLSRVRLVSPLAQTKQNLGLTGGAPDFKPTSNARNVAMIDEARKFSKQLKTLHADLNELSKRYEGAHGARPPRAPRRRVR